MSLDGKSPDLALYFMQPNAVNFNEAETNFRTYYGNQILSFPSKYMVAFDFETLRDDGRAKWNLFTAKGKTGDQEQWVLSGSSGLGGCAVQDVYEFVIPWSRLGSHHAIRHASRSSQLSLIRSPMVMVKTRRWHHQHPLKWFFLTSKSG